MTENMKKFLELASGDAELAGRLNGMYKDAIIAAAQQRGITLTDADFVENASDELSDDELSAAVGGGKCACVMGGSGKKGDNCKECACIIAGGGMFKDDVDRCCCIGAGGGVDD